MRCGTFEFFVLMHFSATFVYVFELRMMVQICECLAVSVYELFFSTFV